MPSQNSIRTITGFSLVHILTYGDAWIISLTMNLYLQLTTKEDKPVISILTSHRELSTFITKQQVGYGMPMAQH